MKTSQAQYLIVFDMDGVLIDVSASYRDVVRQTVKKFLRPARASENLPDPLFPLTDLAVVKQSGGLNNDWDLTYRVIDLLLGLIEKPEQFQRPLNWDGYEGVLKRCDVGRLARYLKTEKNPLAALLDKTQKRGDEFIAAFSRGDVGSGNIIKQIFQEIYLGQHLFASTYNIQPRIYTGEGFIYRETLLIDKSVLAEFAAHHTLAIATGRPRNEADFAVDRHGIRKYFDFIYSLDDCVRAEKQTLEQEDRRVSLSKPNPYMLDSIAAEIRFTAEKCFYIGDMPDDMIAARRSRAGFKGIGFLLTAPDKDKLREDLLRAGAADIVTDLNQLKKIISKGPD
jgi:HAD superfamily hydrolase (TIGR01548 family)